MDQQPSQVSWSNGFHPSNLPEDSSSQPQGMCSVEQTGIANLVGLEFASCTGLDMDTLRLIEWQDFLDIQTCMQVDDGSDYSDCQTILDNIGNRNEKLSKAISMINEHPLAFCRCFSSAAEQLPLCGIYGPMKNLGENLSNTCFYLFEGCDYSKTFSECFQGTNIEDTAFCAAADSSCTDIFVAPLACQNQIDNGLWGQMQKYATECASSVATQFSSVAQGMGYQAQSIMNQAQQMGQGMAAAVQQGFPPMQPADTMGKEQISGIPAECAVWIQGGKQQGGGMRGPSPMNGQGPPGMNGQGPPPMNGQGGGAGMGGGPPGMMGGGNQQPGGAGAAPQQSGGQKHGGWRRLDEARDTGDSAVSDEEGGVADYIMDQVNNIVGGGGGASGAAGGVEGQPGWQPPGKTGGFLPGGQGAPMTGSEPGTESPPGLGMGMSPMGPPGMGPPGTGNGQQQGSGGGFPMMGQQQGGGGGPPMGQPPGPPGGTGAGQGRGQGQGPPAWCQPYLQGAGEARAPAAPGAWIFAALGALTLAGAGLALLATRRRRWALRRGAAARRGGYLPAIQEEPAAEGEGEGEEGAGGGAAYRPPTVA